MNTSEVIAHMQAAIKHETEATKLQALAASLAGKGNYIGAYEALGEAARELKQANMHRKLVSAATLGRSA